MLSCKFPIGSRYLLILIIVCSFRLSVHSQTDSLKVHYLEDIEINAEDDFSSVRGDLNSSINWSMESIESLPKILGISDPIHYVQMLPGVQTTSELSGGLYVNGFDNYHNYIATDGVRVYNPSHLLGLFSVFNTSHYDNMKFSKWAAIDYDCIGASLDMQTSDRVSQKAGIEGSVGLISSQVSLGISVGGKSFLKLSGRTTYINLLYQPLLKAGNYSEWQYHFFDANVSFLTQVDENNIISVNSYAGNDKFVLDLGYAGTDTRQSWENRVMSFNWNHSSGNGFIKQQIYYSSYDNQVKAVNSGSEFTLPSNISDVGWKLNRQFTKDAYIFRYGADISHYDILLQSPLIEGEWYVRDVDQRKQQASKAALFANAIIPIGNRIRIEAGVNATAFNSDNTFLSVDPQFVFNYNTSDNIELKFRLGTSHQFLHQLGFSGGSMPTDFWIASTEDNKPEKSVYTSLGAGKSFFDNKYKLSIDLYYNQLYNQIEYDMNPIDMLTSEFDIQSNIMHGRGYNVGLGIFLQKNTGRLTGWASYSWNRTFRKYDRVGFDSWYPSVFERPHEFNMALLFDYSDKWNFNATFVFAYGTPYTAPQDMFIIGGNVICTYGEHNAERLPNYKRLDISAEYCLSQTDKGRHCIDFSLYNALFSKNVLFYYMRVYETQEKIGRYGLYMFRTCIPSVSYIFKF